MSQLKVTFSGLTTAQTDVSTTAARISTQLDDLKRFINPMVTIWDGEASVAYLEKQRQWDTAASELALVLSQIGTALGAAADNYRNVEMINANRWR